MDDILGKGLFTAEQMAILQERIKQTVESPPTMICVNVVLSGNDALKYAICRDIITTGANVPEETANWYIVRSGIERELAKMTVIVKLDDGDQI